MKRKKLCISLTGLVLLTACGQVAPASSSTDAASIASSSTAIASPTPDSATSPQASDVFDQVTWVEEWQPGQYLISGLDETNASICGILDDMGQVQLFEGYAAVYPLADGRMIASQQPVDTHTAEMGINVEVQALQGNIVDADGNILYEADDTQWLYILNPETIFVVRASTGFEGDVIEEEYADAITSVELGENKLIATLKNSEGDYYIAPFTADGTILEESYPLGSMSLCEVDGDRLLLSDYQQTVAVWDANTGKEYIRFSWDAQDGECWGAYWLSDDWVLVCLYNYDETNTGSRTYAIYDMSGSRIV